MKLLMIFHGCSIFLLEQQHFSQTFSIYEINFPKTMNMSLVKKLSMHFWIENLPFMTYCVYLKKNTIGLFTKHICTYNILCIYIYVLRCFKYFVEALRYVLGAKSKKSCCNKYSIMGNSIGKL